MEWLSCIDGRVCSVDRSRLVSVQVCEWGRHAPYTTEHILGLALMIRQPSSLPKG